MSAKSATIYSFGVFEFDSHTAELRKNGVKLKLQDQPSQVLLKLLQCPGELVTREELRSILWPGDTFVDFENGLNTAVKRLRDALGESADAPVFIETMARKGYRFIAPVSIRGDVAEAGFSLDEDLQRKESSQLAISVSAQQSTVRQAALAKLLLVVGALLLLALGVVWLVVRQSPAPPQLIQTRLTFNPYENPLTASAISPDGKYLAYADQNGTSLRLIKSGETHKLPLPERFETFALAWIPEGTRILASGGQTGENPSIWSTSILGGNLRKLREDAAGPAVSPDGSLIVFLSDFESGYAQGIWVMGVNGEGARKLVTTQAQVFENFLRVVWSPDGQRIAYMKSYSTAQETGIAIESIDLKGGAPTRILSDSRLQDFCWSPDGRILFSLMEGVTVPPDSNHWALHSSATGRKPFRNSLSSPVPTSNLDPYLTKCLP